MSTKDYELLDQTAEDLLHTSRLLPIEQKSFQRISRRLLQPESLLLKRPTQLPSPPPDSSDDDAAEQAAAREKQAEEIRRWREDIMLDFAALESSVVRIQLLQNSNERERKRYADEKIKILESAEAIKENTVELRGQLEGAREKMQLRKTYDSLAETILKNKTLKSRDDQEESMKKTNAEIAEEEKKGQEFEERWMKRHEQFTRVVNEYSALQNIISAEKEELERVDGMEEIEGEGEGDGEANSGARTSAAATPGPDVGGSTPLPSHDAHRLKPLPAGSTRGSRASSPMRMDDTEINDIVMGEAAGTPPLTHSSLEEGEEGEASERNTPIKQ